MFVRICVIVVEAVRTWGFEPFFPKLFFSSTFEGGTMKSFQTQKQKHQNQRETQRETEVQWGISSRKFLCIFFFILSL